MFFATATGESIHSRMQAGLREMIQDDDDDLDFPMFDNDRAKMEGSKSKWKALGLSLILPGSGQYYIGNRGRMTVFGSAEAAVWSGFFGFRIYGGWKKEDYRAWAALRAGADVDGKSEDFFEKMTYYDNLDDYNQFELLFEGSRAELLPSTPEYYWNWDSDASRGHFRDLRNQSKTAYRRSLLFLGAAVANRILSGIDAYRSAGSINKQMEFSERRWGVYCSAVDFLEDGEVEIGIAAQF
jgi:hypothetical protein